MPENFRIVMFLKLETLLKKVTREGSTPDYFQQSKSTDSFMTNWRNSEKLVQWREGRAKGENQCPRRRSTKSLRRQFTRGSLDPVPRSQQKLVVPRLLSVISWLRMDTRACLPEQLKVKCYFILKPPSWFTVLCTVCAYIARTLYISQWSNMGSKKLST